MVSRGAGPTDSTRAHTRARPHETCTILDGRDAGEMIPLRSARPDNPGTFVSSPPCCGFRVEHRSRMGLEVAQSTPRLMRNDFLLGRPCRALKIVVALIGIRGGGAHHATKPATSSPRRALPRRRALCTNWKKAR